MKVLINAIRDAILRYLARNNGTTLMWTEGGFKYWIYLLGYTVKDPLKELTIDMLACEYNTFILELSNL